MHQTNQSINQCTNLSTKSTNQPTNHFNSQPVSYRSIDRSINQCGTVEFGAAGSARGKAACVRCGSTFGGQTEVAAAGTFEQQSIARPMSQQAGAVPGVSQQLPPPPLMPLQRDPVVQPNGEAAREQQQAGRPPPLELPPPEPEPPQWQARPQPQQASHPQAPYNPVARRLWPADPAHLVPPRTSTAAAPNGNLILGVCLRPSASIHVLSAMPRCALSSDFLTHDTKHCCVIAVPGRPNSIERVLWQVSGGQTTGGISAHSSAHGTAPSSSNSTPNQSPQQMRGLGSSAALSSDGSEVLL